MEKKVKLDKNSDMAAQLEKAIQEAREREEKFAEFFMSMNRKDRRKFAKANGMKWNELPKYTKELADKQSQIIRSNFV